MRSSFSEKLNCPLPSNRSFVSPEWPDMYFSYSSYKGTAANLHPVSKLMVVPMFGYSSKIKCRSAAFELTKKHIDRITKCEEREKMRNSAS